MERWSQCTYRCVVLPDGIIGILPTSSFSCFNAPTGAWCSLTSLVAIGVVVAFGLNAPTGAWCSLTSLSEGVSVCTRTSLNAPTGAWCSLTRSWRQVSWSSRRLNAPTGAWCSLTSGFPTTSRTTRCLNAPTGAWCSLTPALGSGGMTPLRGPGAPPAPGAPLRTGQHRAQSST